MKGYFLINASHLMSIFSQCEKVFSLFFKEKKYLICKTLCFTLYFILYKEVYFCVFSFSYLYQIAHLGDDDEEPEFSSTMHLEEGDTFLFQPRTLKNLVVVDEMDSLSPITHCQVLFFMVIFS